MTTTRLATAEMTDCPGCGTPTFARDLCFKCAARKQYEDKFGEADREAREYLNRQAAKDYNYRRFEKERIAELERKAAMYDGILEYREQEKERPWSDDELKRMTEFARGFIQGWAGRPGDEPLEDHWVTFADDIDIHFYFYEGSMFQDGSERDELRVFGYRRADRLGPVAEFSDRDCKDEVKLI